MEIGLAKRNNSFHAHDSRPLRPTEALSPSHRRGQTTRYTELVLFKHSPTLNLPCVKLSSLTGGKKKLATPSVTEVAHNFSSQPQAGSTVSGDYKSCAAGIGHFKWGGTGKTLMGRQLLQKVSVVSKGLTGQHSNCWAAMSYFPRCLK